MTRFAPATSLLALLLLVSPPAYAENAPAKNAPVKDAQGKDAQARDEAALRQLVAAQAEAWNRGDAKAWSKDFAPDADFINIVGTVFQGHDQIEQRHASLFASLFKGSQTQVTVRRVAFISPEVAVVDMVHEVTGHGGLPPGIQNTEPGKLRTQMRYMLKKSAGAWQIAAGQNTDVKPSPK